MDHDGKSVDYVSLKKSKEFEEYLAEVKQLQKVKLESWTEIQRKVFFISILFVVLLETSCFQDCCMLR